jgi:outer membrane autotransporter protein
MTIAEINSSLHQMLPTVFNTLDVIEEQSLSQVQQTLSRQMNLSSKSGDFPETVSCTLWTDVFSAYPDQQSSSNGLIVGYGGHLLGDILGLNLTFSNGAFAGIAGGLSKDNIDWHQSAGDAKMRNAFGALYAGGWFSPLFYAQGALIGSWTHYDTHRNVSFESRAFPPFTETAHGHATGISGLANLELGAVIEGELRVRPFGKVDYTYLHRNQFTESGGGGIDLRVKQHNADVLRAEAGVEFLKHFKTMNDMLTSTPYVILGDAYEWRFVGQTETASFAPISCQMTIDGLFPTQNLPFIEAGLIETFGQDFVSFSMNYRQEWSHHYVNRSWSGQIRISF